jgi:hypothetical protein
MNGLAIGPELQVFAGEGDHGLPGGLVAAVLGNPTNRNGVRHGNLLLPEIR